MLIEPEHYKGILFVRISSLPGEQKRVIRENYSRESIVKILKDNLLLSDCILYDDYVKWYKQIHAQKTINTNKQIPAPTQLTIG